MRTHYGPWQHQKHKSGRGPSSEHFWQVWLISVQRFQRRRLKCEKLTDGRQTLTHDKSSHGLWPGELKNNCNDSFACFFFNFSDIFLISLTSDPSDFLLNRAVRAVSRVMVAILNFRSANDSQV